MLESLFVALAASVKLSVYYNEAAKTYSYVMGEYDSSAPARAIFIDDTNNSGWYNLQIEGPRIFDDTIESKAAGYAEAILTYQLLKPHIKNVYSHLCAEFVQCPSDSALPTVITDFFKSNLQWTRDSIASSPTTDPFYFSASMILAQIDGMVIGYNQMVPNNNITAEDLWTYYSHGSIYNIARMMKIAKKADPIYRRGTAIVGQTSSPDDVFISHASWRSYGEAVRISKRYRIRYASTLSTVDRRTFSSYPFMLHSDDDFMINDNGLALLSTSIAMSDDAIATHQASYQGFPSWFRCITASQSAFSGDTWYQKYRGTPLESTGIEWSIIDIKKFKYKSGYEDEFIFVIDEIPGLILGQDATEFMRQKRFYASLDVPQIQRVYTSAGYDNLSAASADWFDLSNNVRMKILQKKAQTFGDFFAMKKMIRLNNPSSITEQNSSAVNAVAGRMELADATVAKCRGAFDAKATSIQRMLHLMWEGETGPSHDDLQGLDISNCTACKDESKDGVITQQIFGWADQYFDIGL